MTRGEQMAWRSQATYGWACKIRAAVSQLWDLRMRPAINPENMPEMNEHDRQILLNARDRIDEVLNADRNAKEGKRAA